MAVNSIPPRYSNNNPFSSQKEPKATAAIVDAANTATAFFSIHPDTIRLVLTWLGPKGWQQFACTSTHCATEVKKVKEIIRAQWRKSQHIAGVPSTDIDECLKREHVSQILGNGSYRKLNISGLCITHLPKTCLAYEVLVADNCPHFQGPPEEIDVRQLLRLTNSPKAKLPKKGCVGGNLVVDREIPIPSEFKVQGAIIKADD